MTRNEFFRRADISPFTFVANEYALPCFTDRRAVSSRMSTPEMIEAAIEHAESSNDVILFSVTENDGAAWDAWALFAKQNPRKFKVVQGGSIHGNYQARMYIYTKPKSQRKYG
jgi:hypothetical protein